MQINTFSKALADPTRARLLAILLKHELSVGEVVRAIGISQPRVSRHLKILHESGLLRSRREGLWNFYRIGDEGTAGEYVKAISFLLESKEFAADREGVRKVLAERSREVRTFFDEIAEDWERLQRDIFGDFDLNREVLASLSHCTCGVDLGCGTGELLERMASCCDKVIGVDSSPGMLQQARGRLGDRASLRIGALEHLPLANAEADFAAISMVLHHLSDPEKAVAEAIRVLRPGGRLVVADFTAHNNERMRTLYGDRRLGFTKEQLVSWLQTAGMQMEGIHSFPVNKGLTVLVSTARKGNMPANGGKNASS
ncbi:metalloregulator ArsR/SmtB family transcription factor [Desulforhopalus vacuolatus]|uniref:ArsR/SmtB family transcription factor n=1 Tax=Desulforhopalus vacuolatus TaxID=40414 RepID=UPI00196355B5|nr:metalloregulator ArsR/SmtB family transcription factor [Desulforhopalus vacuolatus]MBM9520292.1 metalloregulator ArsR/SmtB family transcription factor [Desulforhopalus vacuolatus]